MGRVFALDEARIGLKVTHRRSWCPFVNPAERWFEALRRALANRIFDSLDELERAVTEFLRPYWDDPAKLQRLTGYPWWCQAVANLPPP